MTCPVLKYLEIFRNGIATKENALDVEVFTRTGCPRMRELTVALNTHIILQDQARKDRDNPTIQEQSKRKLR